MIAEDDEVLDEDFDLTYNTNDKSHRRQCHRSDVASRSTASQRMCELHQTQQRLKSDRESALRRVKYDYDDRMEAVDKEMCECRAALSSECRAKAARDRAIYIEQWIMSGHCVLRDNQFYEPPPENLRRIETDEKIFSPSAKRPLDTIVSNGDNTTALEYVLTLPDGALNTLIFSELGPMELYAVYCVSRCTRRAVQRTLDHCVANCIARLHSDQSEAVIALTTSALENVMTGYKLMCDAAATVVPTISDDRLHIVPLILHATMCLIDALSSYIQSKPRIHLTSTAYMDPSRSFLVSPSQLDPGNSENCEEPLFPYIAPLSRCNVFHSVHFAIVYAALVERYKEVYGESQCVLVTDDPFAFFEHDDWMALDLQPVEPGVSYQRGHLFAMDLRRGTIKALGTPNVHPSAPFRGYTHSYVPTGDNKTCYAFTMATVVPRRASLLSRQPPERYFIDHCVVRRALRKTLLTPEAIEAKNERNMLCYRNEVAILKPTPLEAVEDALNATLDRMNLLHTQWCTTGVLTERLDLQIKVTISITGRDDLKRLNNTDLEDDEYPLNARINRDPLIPDDAHGYRRVDAEQLDYVERYLEDAGQGPYDETADEDYIDEEGGVEDDNNDMIVQDEEAPEMGEANIWNGF